MADLISIIGLIALIATSIGFLPQVIKTWKTRKTRDISLYMIALWMIGTGSWFIYGLMKNDAFIMSANGIIFSLTVILLALKLKYEGK
ncbi:MAG TPA: SemiSWEET transporter [archaeon]|nr:SemiSWEET transporter [archaeon]